MTLPDNLKRAIQLYAEKAEMTTDEVLEEIRLAIGGDDEVAPVQEERTLSSEDRQAFRTHGIDKEQRKALALKDGGRAYRELMLKRSTA